MALFELDHEQRELLRRFHDEGLLWLINAAILHPRGFALAIHYPDPDDPSTMPLGLSIQGDGSEPWAFGDGIGDSAERFNAAEARREAAWTPKLREKDSSRS